MKVVEREGGRVAGKKNLRSRNEQLLQGNTHKHVIDLEDTDSPTKNQACGNRDMGVKDYSSHNTFLPAGL